MEYNFIHLLLLLLLLKDNPALDEVGAGAPLRPNVSKGSVTTTPVGGLLLGGPPGAESFLILLGLLIILIYTFIELLLMILIHTFIELFMSF